MPGVPSAPAQRIWPRVIIGVKPQLRARTQAATFGWPLVCARPMQGMLQLQADSQNRLGLS